MIATYQEDEMYVASKYLKDLSNAFMVLLSEKNREFSDTKKAVEDKLNFERKEIEFLKSQIDKCRRFISDNQNRISEIEREINELKRDIDHCQDEIDSTEVPAYTSVYSEYYGWYEVVDSYRTRIREEYISTMSNRIYEDNNRIKELEEEKKKDENNISSLQNMINDIQQVIQMKQQLVNEINQSATILGDQFNKFKSEINKRNAEISELDNKVRKSAQTISSFGNTLKTVGYQDMKISYSSRSVLSLTTASLKEEIDTLVGYQMMNTNLLKSCYKACMDLSIIGGEVVEQAQDITKNALTNSKKINDIYEANNQKLKKALDFLYAYENIHF